MAGLILRAETYHVFGKEGPEMNVLIIGSGGREHSLAWAIAKSPVISHLYCSPGNGGIEKVADCIDLNFQDHKEIIRFCQSTNITFVIIGPEDPLVNGLADDLRQAGIKVFGPSKAASALEGSKGFTKDLCRKYDIPTANYARFDNPGHARSYVERHPLPIVIKADGLAAGKGVTIAMSRDEANEAIDDCFGGRFGQAGAEVVIEECLVGEEASFFVLTDGETILPLATAQDHKRAFDGDKGPNTGGMGAYSPAPVMTGAMCRRTLDEIVKPTIEAMNELGIPFQGVLYAGLMITEEGPKLIEYNVRFGDPECQVLMLRLKSDILPALIATNDKTLDHIELEWRQQTALTVVMAARGYPGAYEKGSLITGLEGLERPEVQVFHAGTLRDDEGIKANGGRVLNITALGDTVREARDLAYDTIEQINWPEGFNRNDIGWRAIKGEENAA